MISRERLPLRLAGAILLLAAALRFHALGHEALWCDEAYTALTVRLPATEMVATLLQKDDAPPLFYILEKGTTTLLGDSEAGLRALSAAAGVATVAVVLAWSVRRRFGPAGWSASYLAVATYGVFLAREARSYSLLLLLGTLLVLSAKDLLFGRRRAGPLLAGAATLLCLTHHVAITLVLTSLLLWTLGARTTRPRLATWALWHLPAVAVWAALWIGAGAQLRIHAELNAWIGHYWQSHSIAAAPLYSIALFVPGGLPLSELAVWLPVPIGMASAWALVSAGLGLVCLIAAFWIPRALAERREVVVEAGFGILPLLGLLAASVVATPVYVLGRTDVLAYPGFVLLIGRGLWRLPRPAAASLFVFWAALSVWALAPSHGFGREAVKGTDRRLATEMEASGLAPGDWVVHTSMTAPTLEYYLIQPHQIAWFPKVTGVNAASDYPAPADSLEAYLAEALALRRRMEASIPEDGSAWILGVLEPVTAGVAREERLARPHGVAPVIDRSPPRRRAASERSRLLESDSPLRSLTAEQVAYPTGLLVYTLIGRESVRPVFVYNQDLVAGERVALRVPRRAWVPLEEVVALEVEFAPDESP